VGAVPDGRPAIWTYREANRPHRAEPEFRRFEDDAERVLTHAGMPDSVDHLAIQVISRMARHGLELPEGWLAEECPGWPESWSARPTRG
jgi:hypothetical protein